MSRMFSLALVFLLACGGAHFEEVDDNNFGAENGGSGGVSGDGETVTTGQDVSILPDRVTLPDVAPGTGIIYGKVINNATGAPVADVLVTAGELSDTSGSDGTYLLANVPFDNRVVVNADVNGFSEQSKIVVVSESQKAVILNIPLLTTGAETTFDPTADQVIEAGIASVSISADSLAFMQDDQEVPPTGQVTATITNVDGSTTPTIMPGDYLNDNGDYIESFGAISVSLVDESGNALDLTEGSTASISIPVANTATPMDPSTLYSYSRDTGLWSEEGQISLNGSSYVGDVSHFSTWNADFAYPAVDISGCVEDDLGNPLAGVVVNVRGSDYIGTSSAIVGSDGTFVVKAKENSRVLVSASDQGRPSNTAEVNTGSGASISECLIITNVSISVSLTWGANPEDLDTHFVGPDYHVYFASQGSLTSAPFAALDVDDVTGFGPEVLTVNQFTQEGEYIYSVYTFFGEGTITSSPTRVELNYNGDTFVFVPPPGQGDALTWNVFKIIVDADLNVSDIRTVNTWTSAQPGL